MHVAALTVVFLIMAQGAQTAGGSVGGIAVATLALYLVAYVYLTVYLLTLKRGKNAQTTTMSSAIPWTLALLPSIAAMGLLVNWPSPFSGLLPYITYALVSLLAFLVWRERPKAAARMAFSVMLVHALFGVWETITQQSVFYGAWKLGAAQDIAGLLRVASTPADPNYLALTLLLLAPLSLPAFMELSRARRIIFGSVIAMTALLTFSRSLMVAVAIAILVALTVRETRAAARRVLIGTGLITGISFVVAPSLASRMLSRFTSIVTSLVSGGTSDASTGQRLQVQQFTLEAIKEQPLFGYGPGSSPGVLQPRTSGLVPLDAYGNDAYLAQTSTLNTYLTVWLELGIFGLLGLLLLLLLMWRRASEDRFWLLTLVAATVMIATLDVVTLAPFWVFVGATFAVKSRLLPVRNDRLLLSRLVRG